METTEELRSRRDSLDATNHKLIGTCLILCGIAMAILIYGIV
jgi:hypothetical protein